MKILMRKTMAGNEYWDTKEKRTLFVPAGKKPDFEITENPKSMIDEEPETVASTMGVSEKDVEITDLSNMTAEELKQYAYDKGIDIPGNIKKEDTIRKHISDNWVPDEE
jgi:hypothetical protein